MTSPDAADTIAAISTPLGEAGIGIVRLSGPLACAITRRLFRPHRPRPTWQSHRLSLGHIVDPQGEIIDEVMVSLMRAPYTYTREDVVEINCHSGYGVLRRILDLALAAGARLARPGEFTLRAFLSGRLDLTQAEAVLEVIRARTETHLQVAAAHLHGGLGRRLTRVRQDLLDLLAQVEAALDFPEEAGELPVASIKVGLDQQLVSLKTLAETYAAGRLLREGLLVVIAGRPNVGKSSLLNRLLDMERAIVTEIPGTTRDLVEESITLGGVVVRFSDTAGLRPAQDRLEELGIARTRERLQQADLVLYLVDGSAPLASEDRAALAELAGQPGLVVINKIDLEPKLSEDELLGCTAWPLTKISAKTGQGIEALQEKIVAQALGGGLKVQGEVVTQARHHQHLGQCLTYLRQARGLLGTYETPPWELVALELGSAIHELGEITGEEVGEAILDRIFGQFCLGK
ncbi:MAG: tRNA uridine-5-carboxymethylaminomethyl(34) synthesis GTPase MnmE [Desulfobacca sp. RBG_16_60_12]|nr:MAG: tRNA uridine-5-carboxymethylaminomethyl(34) synthesis GTPase MnmE [Desulfobacca sp. RBG_16_60_12]